MKLSRIFRLISSQLYVTSLKLRVPTALESYTLQEVFDVFKPLTFIQSIMGIDPASLSTLISLVSNLTAASSLIASPQTSPNNLPILSLDAISSSGLPISSASGSPLSLTSETSTTLTNFLASTYTDASYFDNLPFESHSHWLQPWRAYSEAVPATTFLNGIGVVFDLINDKSDINADLAMQMLSQHGVRSIRLEINWGKINYDNENQLNDAERFRSVLEEAKKWGIRPLILLNGNQGAPTPTQFFNRTVTSDAQAGSQRIRLDDTSGLVIGKSGLNNLTDYWATESIITAINGKTVTLSKPLPNAIDAGTSVSMATLKYRPFSEPGSADYNETIAGWQHYVGTVAEFAANALGTTESADKGFDMEIWNELTFGSEFLSINNYYKRDPSAYEEESIWANLVKATADYAVANPSQFAGVQFTNGFANTIPWTASSQQPERITAISKHPYAGRKNYPADEQNGTNLDALGQPSDFVPTYSALFPEYFATALQTETIIRDTAPLSTDIYGTQHGRYARKIDGEVVPTEVWITEVGIAPDEFGITDRDQALALKAKTTARYYTFYLNKGVTKVDLYSAASGDLGFGIVQDNFLDYAKSNSVYPVDDSAYVSPALQVTGRITAKMQENLDPGLTQTRPISLDSITDTHNHYQFVGDGTAAHPNLYNRDVFAFLPYQVNASRFVIPYYVMTRDVTQNLPPEEYTIQISGLEAFGASVSVYDPISDRAIPITINSRGHNFLNLTLTATDYPYLLIIQENKLLHLEASNSQAVPLPQAVLLQRDDAGDGLMKNMDALVPFPTINRSNLNTPFFLAPLLLENTTSFQSGIFQSGIDVEPIENSGSRPDSANDQALNDSEITNPQLNQNEEQFLKYSSLDPQKPAKTLSDLESDMPPRELKPHSNELSTNKEIIDANSLAYSSSHISIDGSNTDGSNPFERVTTDFIGKNFQALLFEKIASRSWILNSLANFGAYWLNPNQRILQKRI